MLIFTNLFSPNVNTLHSDCPRLLLTAAACSYLVQSSSFFERLERFDVSNSAKDVPEAADYEDLFYESDYLKSVLKYKNDKASWSS